MFQGPCGVVASYPLRMRKAQVSNPSASIDLSGRGFHWQPCSATTPQGEGRRADDLSFCRAHLVAPNGAAPHLKIPFGARAHDLWIIRSSFNSLSQGSVCLKLHRCTDHARSCCHGRGLGAPLCRAWAPHCGISANVRPTTRSEHRALV